MAPLSFTFQRQLHATPTIFMRKGVEDTSTGPELDACLGILIQYAELALDRFHLPISELGIRRADCHGRSARGVF